MLLSTTRRLVSTRTPVIHGFSHRSIRCFIYMNRNFSSSSSSSEEEVVDLKSTKVLFVGERNKRYGTREYILLRNEHSFQDYKENSKLKLASIRAHRNMIFAANVSSDELKNQILLQQDDEPKQKHYTNEEDIDTTTKILTFTDICTPLLDAALHDAHSQGEQPQALSAIPGLSRWVTTQMIKYEKEDDTLESQIIPKLAVSDQDSKVYEACKAIATQIPRQGHKVVGVNTYKDGEMGWKELAKEFIELGHCDEAELYKSKSAELATIEHLAHKTHDYLESAGGAMARFFFL